MAGRIAAAGPGIQRGLAARNIGNPAMMGQQQPPGGFGAMGGGQQGPVANQQGGPQTGGALPPGVQQAFQAIGLIIKQAIEQNQNGGNKEVEQAKAEVEKAAQMVAQEKQKLAQEKAAMSKQTQSAPAGGGGGTEAL